MMRVLVPGASVERVVTDRRRHPDQRRTRQQHIVRQDRDVPISGESARAHVELARATYKSAFTRTVVRLPLATDDPFYGPEGTTPSWGRGSVGA